jgi:hypothetical protein
VVLVAHQLELLPQVRTCCLGTDTCSDRLDHAFGALWQHEIR